MTETKEPEGKKAKTFTEQPEARKETDPCADIQDPVRRGLCKVCGLPVIGEAPFCKNHETPVP